MKEKKSKRSRTPKRVRQAMKSIEGLTGDEIRKLFDQELVRVQCTFDQLHAHQRDDWWVLDHLRVGARLVSALSKLEKTSGATLVLAVAYHTGAITNLDLRRLLAERSHRMVFRLGSNGMPVSCVRRLSAREVESLASRIERMKLDENLPEGDQPAASE